MRSVWVTLVALGVALVAALSLGDLFGFDAWAWFDGLGLGMIPKGIWVLGLAAIGGLAYVMERKTDE